jgi:hypothetical protein
VLANASGLLETISLGEDNKNEAHEPVVGEQQRQRRAELSLVEDYA